MRERVLDVLVSMCLLVCKGQLIFSCWPEEFKCLDKTCVDMSFRCDGVWDCKRGEDEMSCDKVCQVGMFTCQDHKSCVPIARYCDGSPDCPDGSDEFAECLCHKVGKFACRSGDRCVHRLLVCDGVANCQDGSDEADCDLDEEATANQAHHRGRKHRRHRSGISDARRRRKNKALFHRGQHHPKLMLRVYPKVQTVSLGEDAVIWCRDEGHHKVPVYWTESPASSSLSAILQGEPTSLNRLEIRQVNFTDTRYFICKASGHEMEHGGHMLSILKVRVDGGPLT